jgi:AraC-like DNA-binding protein
VFKRGFGVSPAQFRRAPTMGNDAAAPL